MRKLLWLIVCLMTMVVSVNAQNEWVVSEHEADELLETEAYKSVVYTSNDCGIVLWDNESAKFRILSDKGTFDTEVVKWAFKYRSVFTAIVGYYDINGKLLSKKKCQFEIGSNHRQAHSMKDTWGHNEGKNVISFLRNEKGYVRLIAPLSGTNSKFDIKVPCMNN